MSESSDFSARAEDKLHRAERASHGFFSTKKCQRLLASAQVLATLSQAAAVREQTAEISFIQANKR